MGVTAAEVGQDVQVQDRSWNRRLLVLSAGAAVAVSVIYLPQSLLTDMAAGLGVPPGRAGWVATAVQAGYALGILLLVPLADRVHPRRQVTVQSLLLAAALALSAVMPEVVSLALAFAVVGLVANLAQIIIPAAGRLAPEGAGGATTGTLVGFLTVGIFGGRIVSSLLVEALGWRLVTLVFAGLVLTAAPFLRRALDAELELPGTRTSYPQLLRSTVVLLRRSPELVQSGLMNFFVFATFNAIWTVMVLHLTSPPFGWSVRSAGLFGLVGLGAGLVSTFAGRLVDRFGTLPVAGAFLALMLAATASGIADSGQLVAFAITMFVVTAASQAVQGANQNRILAANPGNAAQANTGFMFLVFLGGSAGAFLGPWAYGAGGMTRVAELGCGLLLLALVVWAWTVVATRRAVAADRARSAAQPEPAPHP